MKCALLLDIVIREGAAIFELLASENQTLLIRGDTLLVLDFGLDILYGVRGLDFKGDSLASECLNENLHATTQAEDEVEGALLLDVVVRQGTPVFELLASEDETLLVRRNSFLVLNLALHVLDGVRGLHLERDGLARQGLDEDLHGGGGVVVRRRLEGRVSVRRLCCARGVASWNLSG